MNHLPYRPDLASCDFYLLPNIKNKLCGQRFSNTEAAVEAYHTIVSEISTYEWHKCFENKFGRMEKSITSKAEYFKKE